MILSINHYSEDRVCSQCGIPAPNFGVCKPTADHARSLLHRLPEGQIRNDLGWTVEQLTGGRDCAETVAGSTPSCISYSKPVKDALTAMALALSDRRGKDIT